MSVNQIFRKILISMLFLTGMLAQTGCAPEPEHFGIIYTNSWSSDDGPMDIYRITYSPQKKVEQLTFTPTVGEYSLLVSNNGDQIIFRTDHYYDSEMEPAELEVETLRHAYLLDTTSMQLVDVTHVLDPEYDQLDPWLSMDWLPDQEQFVVVTHEGAEYDIDSFLEFVDFDGANRNAVPIPTVGEIPALINGAKWSPDGSRLILTQRVLGFKQQLQNPGDAILVYKPESGDIVQLTGYQDSCGLREWSPSNRQIVVTCSFYIPLSEGISGPSTVRILDVEHPGQPYERIGFSPCYDPSWSPDGKQLVFVCDKGMDRKGLFIVNSDGSGLFEVAPGDLGNPVILNTPLWSPDGTRIVFVAGRDFDQTNIYAVRTDGSQVQALTDQEAYYNLVSVYPLP